MVDAKGRSQAILRSFDVSLAEMRRIIRDFHSEMEKGLSGAPSSLSMIPAYVTRPTGREKGRFIALDLGGTNLRILEAELKGGGHYKISKVKRYLLGRKYLSASRDEFFGFLASSITDFVKGRKEYSDLGFTFSFPVKQTAIDSGILLRWTKGFNVKGVVGEDVVVLLKEALRRRGVNGIDVASLVNDTVGTLAAKGYKDPHCDLGVIIGTGTNACYLEELAEIPKWKGRTPSGARMIVNTEWGNFDKLRRTGYDLQLDRASDRPGRQILEKMVSGMYLGRIVQLVVKDLMKKDLRPFDAEAMSRIEAADLKSLSGEKKLIRKVCNFISRRAARISAAALAAIVTKIDPNLSGNHTIAIDGSVYEKHPNFSGEMRSALRELFGKQASRIKISLSKDGSGVGAAIIAAVASSQR